MCVSPPSGVHERGKPETHNTKRETQCFAVGKSKCWGYLLRLVYDGLGNFNAQHKKRNMQSVRVNVGAIYSGLHMMGSGTFGKKIPVR